MAAASEVVNARQQFEYTTMMLNPFGRMLGTLQEYGGSEGILQKQVESLFQGWSLLGKKVVDFLIREESARLPSHEAWEDF